MPGVVGWRACACFKQGQVQTVGIKRQTLKGERTGEEMISSERYKELCGKAPPIISGTQQVLST